ncbi:hypothetical protein ACFY71_23530 [Streptomyces cinerochromogenes]|uniref:hypothetical protein n=1 Tax=Streptomyces cinerochromogenes TaxID=66422 RepID=UPI0036A90870
MLRRISLVLTGLLAAGFVAAAPAAAHDGDIGYDIGYCWQSGGAASAGDTHALWGEAGCAHVG